MLLDARDGAREIAGGGRGVEPSRQRHIRQLGLAEPQIQRHAKWRGRARWRPAPRRAPPCAEPPGSPASARSRRRAASVFAASASAAIEAALRVLPLDLGDLLLEKGDVGGAGVAGFAANGERREHRHNGDAGEKSKDEPDHGPLFKAFEALLEGPRDPRVLAPPPDQSQNLTGRAAGEDDSRQFLGRSA